MCWPRGQHRGGGAEFCGGIAKMRPRPDSQPAQRPIEILYVFFSSMVIARGDVEDMCPYKDNPGQ